MALPLPDAVQDHLDLAVGAMVPDAADVDPRRGPQPLRWVSRHLRHITLAFYGEVPGGAVPELAGELEHAMAPIAPLRLRLRGAGVFSHRTLWVGVQEQGPGDSPARATEASALPSDTAAESRALFSLMAACEDAGEPVARVERRDRRRAHVTLARIRARRPTGEELTRRAQALSVYAGPPWTATHVHLVASDLGAGKGGAPQYEVLEEFALGGV